VWRFEVRIGKDILKSAGVRTFKEVSACIGDLMAQTVEKIRLVSPIDSNITRCPDAPIWAQLRADIARDLHDAQAGVCEGVVKETTRQRVKAQFDQLLQGTLLTYAALDAARDEGEEAPNAQAVAQHVREVAENVVRLIDIDPDEVSDRVGKAVNRYRMVSEHEWQKRKEAHTPPDLRAA